MEASKSRKAGHECGNRVSHVGETRTVLAGDIVHDKKHKRSNKIKTSKYSLLSFLPKNLAEQFRRTANFYFLLVTIVAVVIDSPVSPVTSLAPLVFVIAITMAKQGYEDWLRHRIDHAVNNELVTVVRKSICQQIKCREIQPGELVRISRDCDVPCDAVLLWTSDPRGKCHVTTANLDGETSLKPLRVPPPLANTTLEEKLQSSISIECLQPEADIYTFYGKITVDEEKTSPVGTENLLLRGSRVKNTEWAIGCAVYTGEETKLALNSRFTSNKFTSCESFINRYLVFYVVLMIAEIEVSFFLKRYLERDDVRGPHEQYLGPNTSDNSFGSIAQDTFAFLLLYYYCIPISLYVSIEMQKFIGSLFLEWDKELTCPETDQPAVANSSDLNEELGQIEILFSDKTGTLTKNDMYFQMCSVNGDLYVEKNKQLFELNESWRKRETVEAVESDSMKPDLRLFFTILALCHTVQVEEDLADQLSARLSNGFTKSNNNTVDLSTDSVPKYQAMSADEVALVRAAANRGIIFCGDEANKMFIKDSKGNLEEYEKLQVIEFNSTRKRMSVVVRDKLGKIWLFCKGAESSVLPLCADSPLLRTTDAHVRFFAEQGLRTLAVAYKVLSEQQYQELSQELSRINLDIHGRASGDGGAARWRALEEGLSLLGGTGVEDRLQDDVADTLGALRGAGISIWVLTGDKVETAINVAQSCGHITQHSRKLFLTEIRSEESLHAQLRACTRVASEHEHATPASLALVLDGQSLALLLGSRHETAFVELSLRCEAVICCRLSPLQKAQIVRLIKKSPGSPITAAVGDGANDISMIQEAHVGFGIFGREGRQAARCADFAFTKFLMLKRILLVHGHLYYQRLATLVQYFFYKNLIFVNLMLFFQFHSNFSTQSILDSMYLTFFNLIFTSAPIFALSLTEQCHSPNILMSDPNLYKKQIKNKLLSWSHFLGWFALGIYHSVVIFYFYYAIWLNPIVTMDGRGSGMWCFGSIIFNGLVVLVNLKVWLHARYRTYIFMLLVLLSILVFVLFSALYTFFYIPYDGDVMGTYTRQLGSFMFWISTLLVVVASLLPDYIFKTYKAIFRKRKTTEEVIEIMEVTRL